MQETSNPNEQSENYPYRPITTGDGSPSLEWLATGEAMHNRLGAISETVEIYGSAVLEASATGLPIRVLSVGLGLGYNEIMIATLALKMGKTNIELLSFEENESLRNNWISWLHSKPCYLFSTYESICERFSSLYKIPSEDIKKQLRSNFESKRWQLQIRLDSQFEFGQTFNCILYDPFSSKTNPECWEESFLYELFNKVCEPFCVVSTYSAKGTLKRSLKALGFNVTTPFGFGGKRNRTYAVRASL